MSQPLYTLLCYAGDHKAWTLTPEDKRGNPIDLSNRRIVFTAKADIDDADNQALFKKIYNIAESDTEVNNFVLELFTAETKDIFGIFECDIRVSFQGNPTEIQYSVRGKLNIEKSVTNNMEQ